MQKIFLFFIFFSLNVLGQENLQPHFFRIAPVAAFQDTGTSYSTLLSWNPIYTLGPEWSLGLNVGATAFETKDRDKYFVLEYQVTAAYRWDPDWATEMAAGFQNWITEGGDVGAFSLNVMRFYDYAPLRLDRFFLGYSFVNSYYERTQQVKVGIGLAL